MNGIQPSPAADDRTRRVSGPLRGLVNDRWLIAGAVVFALSTVPYWTKVFNPVQKQFFGDFWVTLPFTLLATAALAHRAWTARLPREMRFWRLWAIAFALWSLAMLGQALLPQPLWEFMEVSLSLDAVYTAFYLCIALALELHPWSPQEDVSRRLRAFETSGGLILVFAALFYFMVIPLRLHPEGLDYFAPSLLMYVVMDAYLAFRLVALVGRARGTIQPSVYALLAAALGWCVLTDLYEYLAWNEVVPWIAGGTYFDLLWFPAPVLVVVASRVGAQAQDAVEISPATEPQPLKPIKAGLLVVYAGTFPFLHAVLYRLRVLDPATERPRLIAAVLFMLLLAGLAVAYQRLLDAERGRLEANRLLEARNKDSALRMEALGRMAGGIAHDFNNLLTVIGGSQEVVKADLPEGASASEWLDEIGNATHRARLLTQQLLAFSRQLPGQLVTVPANSLVPANERSIRTLLGPKIRFEFVEEGEPAWVHIDSAQFQRVLLNLASNSRDAMPNGGAFQVRYSTRSLSGDDASRRKIDQGDYVMFEVHDTGHGLEEGSAGKIFEPYFTTKRKGTGLGLAACFGILRQFDGYLEASNAPDGGALFTLLLPRVERPSRLDSAAAEIRARARTPQSATLLLAEDETAMRKLMTHMLADQGYTILEARSGEEALAIAGTYDSKIDLLLTDIFMPGMSGFELALELARERPETRIAYCSGNPTGHVLARQGRHAAVPFLPKPFDRRTLSAFVDGALADSVDNA